MLKMLFVDDETDIRELVEIALMVEPDFEAEFAGSGAEAIEILKEHDFDVIMLDVMMPPPDGLDVLQAARSYSKFNQTLIVMCTAKTSRENEAEFRALGANHVLHKPFKPLRLAGYIRSIADRVK